jgi:hypothetical protein
MKVVTAFPRRVREIENVWIPLADGCRLAARMWLPEDAEADPVPALLEYLPYRKRDLMRGRDEAMHRYYAGCGYAAVRVDIRGSGDSDGVLEDEYSEQELADALEVIAWLAAQPWCSGAVGMFGISWGGFNALQVAARRPPALKAIISVCSTDDRYADDAHYMGGCLIAENQGWGALLFAEMALPPDPEIVGERWRAMWLERLNGLALYPARWLRHQRRDAYWRRGSVCEDYAAIRCPVFLVGGWADAYRNAIPRMLERLSAPRRGLIGPWSHSFPHDSVPGPSIGFLQEAIRWWDHWLKGIDTGVMREPMLRAWIQDHVRPQGTYDERPGRWVGEERWPSPRIAARRLHFGPASLAETPHGSAARTIASPQTTGLAAGQWCAFGGRGEMPLDQRVDDGRSLVFDSAPLAERLEILGAPVATLDVECDQPVAMIGVRLCDVASDGAATRVTYGLLNLTHRDGHAEPAPLVPGRRYRIAVRLNDIGYAFPAGHVIRLAVSTCHWPTAWPSPAAARLTLHTGESTLDLPARPPSDRDAGLAPFAPPEHAAADPETTLGRGRFRRVVEYDVPTGETASLVERGGDEDGAMVFRRLEAIRLEIGHRASRRQRIDDDDPLSAVLENRHEMVLRRDGWSVRVETEVRLTATADAFRMTARLRAHDGDKEVCKRDWDEKIPRDLM